MEVGMVVVVAAKVLVSLWCVGACCLAAYLYRVVWVAPRRVLAEFRRQGIGGPRPSFPYGNLADMREAVAAARHQLAEARRRRRARDSGDGGSGAGIVHDYRPAVLPFYEKWRKDYGTHPNVNSLAKLLFTSNSLLLIKQPSPSLLLLDSKITLGELAITFFYNFFGP
ncbi:hypothetical protein OsJ_10715 [Oryza sativa Japonica Group]|nr:hypothetical protein OsJ_10715 [Oryza sativa Japonica Group]